MAALAPPARPQAPRAARARPQTPRAAGERRAPGSTREGA